MNSIRRCPLICWWARTWERPAMISAYGESCRELPCVSMIQTIVNFSWFPEYFSTKLTGLLENKIPFKMSPRTAKSSRRFTNYMQSKLKKTLFVFTISDNSLKKISFLGLKSPFNDFIWIFNVFSFNVVNSLVHLDKKYMFKMNLLFWCQAQKCTDTAILVPYMCVEW